MGSTEKKEKQREKQLKREEKKLEIFKQKYEEVFSKSNKFKGWSDNAKNKVKTKTLELCEGSELDEQFKKIETKLVKKITKAKSMKKPLYESQMKQKKIQFCTKHMSLLGSFSGLLTTMINICRYTEKTSGIKDAKLTGKKKTTKNKKTQKKKAKFTAKADILKKIYIEALVKQYEDIKGKKGKTKKGASGDIGEYENIPERLKNILTIVYKQTAAAPAKAKGTAAAPAKGKGTAAAPAKGKGDKGKDAKAGKGAAPAKGKGEKGKDAKGAAPAKGKGSNIEEKMKTMTIENINCQKVKLSKEDLKILKLNKKLVTGERSFYGKKKSGTAKLERKSEYKKANQKYKKDKGKSPKAP